MRRRFCLRLAQTGLHAEVGVIPTVPLRGVSAPGTRFGSPQSEGAAPAATPQQDAAAAAAATAGAAADTETESTVLVPEERVPGETDISPGLSWL